MNLSTGRQTWKWKKNVERFVCVFVYVIVYCGQTKPVYVYLSIDTFSAEV